MPPSPRLKATVDADELCKVCDELQLDSPPGVVFRTGQPNQRVLRAGRVPVCFGQYDEAKNVVIIYMGIDEYEADKLRYVQSEIVITILHELRHAYQKQHWAAEDLAADRARPYMLRKAERDAETWAVENASRFRRIVRVIRRTHGSGFSKIQQTASAVRAKNV